MKRLSAITITLVLLFGSIVYSESVDEMLSVTPVEYKPKMVDLLIGGSVVEMLNRYHYNAAPMSASGSSKWFNEYLRTLDPQKIYFLQSDIEEFREYETRLWDPERHAVKAEAAYIIYSRLIKRTKERALFAIPQLDKEQDFSVKEYVTVDRKNSQPPADAAEQRILWQRLLKNEILTAIFDTEDEDAEFASGKKKADAERKTLSERLDELKRTYARSYKRRAEREQIEVFGTFMYALTMTYDPHSSYNTPFISEDFDIKMRLSLQGIGATLSVDGAYVKVVEIVSGGAADREGHLKKGDRIIAVAQDGKEDVDVVEMPLNKVVQLIRGPKGTKVHLTVLPKGSRRSEHITITRDEIMLKDDEAKSEIRKITLDDGSEANVLFMRLPSFYCDFESRFAGKDYKSTTKDMQALLEKAKVEGKFDGIILDIRSNGGGSLEEVISLTGLFMDKSPYAVQVRDARGIKSRKSDVKMMYSGPMIVMIDRLSASASEIFAAALQDYGRAIIVGDKRSFGKGTVQNVFDLGRMLSSINLPEVERKEFGSLHLTIGKFYRINGGSTQQKGVESDIAFESVFDHMEIGESDMPFVLPWDEIAPVSYGKYNEVATLLPKLKSASEKRRAESEVFQLLHKNIENYKKFMDVKEIPLEMTERREFKKSQDEADKLVKEFRKLLDDKTDADDDDEGVKKPTDIVLEETFNIMKDYIQEVKK